MSMILDLIVIAIAALAVWSGWRGGFAKTVISFFGFFVALIGGYILAPHLAVHILPKIRDFFANEPDGSILGSLGNFDFTATVVANVISFGILFVALSILIFIVKIIVKNVFKLPALKQADKLLGLLLGIILGYLFVSVASLIMFTFSEILIRAFDGLSAEMFEGSVVARWFYEHNIFRFIMELGS